MRVIALGGSGDMGQTAVRTLLQSPAIDEIVVADYDIGRAHEFVATLGDGRVLAQQVDIMDRPALEALLREGDFVMNTAGPFCRLGVPAVRAAIATGRHYVDINDDWKPTQEALELDGEARRAGVTVLLGMGASPGLTNLLARHAADQLDEVDYIQTVWGSVGGRRRPRSAVPAALVEAARVAAATVHFLYCASGRIPVFRDGRFVEIEPLADSEEVAFPNGKGKFYYIGHAEPVTLPRYIKGLRGACNLCGVGPEACIDPMPFFRRYAEHWATPPASEEEILYEVVDEL